MISSMVAGLLVAATTLAVSPHSDRMIAASDGARVWVTQDAGQTWRQIANRTMSTGGIDRDAPLAGVRSLAFWGPELLWSTSSGLKTWTPGNPMPHVRSARVFAALCVWENTLFATQDDTVYRSDDGGKSFVALLRTPGAPVRSLAVSADRMLASTASGTFSHDGVAWRRVSGPAHLAASSDGSLWRAGSLGIERSTHGQHWQLFRHGRFSAIAVGPGQIWAATAGRVLSVVAQPAVAQRDPAVRQARFAASLKRALAASRRAQHAAWLPTVHITARARVKTTRGAALRRRREGVLSLSLAWALGTVIENRATLSALRVTSYIHHLTRTGAKP